MEKAFDSSTIKDKVSEQFEVSVIGGAGHVGLGMCLVLAKAGHRVQCIDKDEKKLEKIESGLMPFKEEGGKEILGDVLEENLLHFSTEIGSIDSSDVIIVVVGTPIDEHKNPEMDNFLSVIEDIKKKVSEGQLIILRSTIYPRSSRVVKELLERDGYKIGEDLYLVYAPERVAQHKTIEEMIKLPQLIGAFDDKSYEFAKFFFNTYLKGDCLRLKPTEAELGKLFTNMWRYIQFAISNEFYLITESFNEGDINVNKILDKTAHDYPRFNPPSPGANVGGPCLTKDGWFLADNIPYDEMISTAYNLNEGIAKSIINRMMEESPKPEKVTLLGMTFKRGSDDIRDSIAFKFKRKLGIDFPQCDVVEVEPHLKEYDKLEDSKESDWVILVTPHEQFRNLSEIASYVKNEACLYCDIWGYWEELKYKSNNGLFYGKEITK